MEDRYVKTRFGRIHYKVHAGGPVRLVLIHGFAASTRSWMRLIEHLPDELYVCAIDLLGHGESDAPDLDYTIAEQKECIAAVVKQEQISEYYLFGHSYGGWITVSYALQEKEVKGIMLEDGAGLKEFYEMVRGTVQREAYKHEMMRKAVALGTQEHVAKSILEDEFSEHMIEEEDLQQVRCPALVLWGTDDAIVDPKFGEIIHRNIAGSELKMIKGAKHTAHYTHSEEVARLILEFMDRGVGNRQLERG